MKARWLLLSIACVGLTGCYRLLPSDGGGETDFSPPRAVDAADVALPPGYDIEVVAQGFTFPTGVAFDDEGTPHIVESGYAYGEVWTAPQLIRVNEEGSTTVVAKGRDNGPWNGVTYADGNFYIAEGGELHGGRILKVTDDGQTSTLIDNLPSKGDHHTNGPVVGQDGRIYLGQGTATNAGVVGEDNANFGWLHRFPRFHDTPCEDVTLSGQNFETADVLNDETNAQVVTGAFSPFGTPTRAGQVIEGALPCNGAIMRINPDGSGLELVAWGFRNPYGLAFAPDGQLYATDNAYDDRGSRPVWGTGDYLWRVVEGSWHGWPDFSGGTPLKGEHGHDHFGPPGGTPLSALLQEQPNQPPKPAATLGVHASVNGLDFSRSSDFGYVGQAFMAEFGDMSPDTGKSLHPVGFRVTRVDVDNGQVEDFAVNQSKKHGPASKIGTAGLERPVAVRFDPSGNALYVVDFGVMLMTEEGPRPQQGTGVLWKITNKER